MENNIKILPLLKYTLITTDYDGIETETVFTADRFETIYNDGFMEMRFYRTSNLVRVEFNRPTRMIVTPADGE